MQHDPVDEHAAEESLPTQTERNYGLIATGVISAAVIGTAIYWIL
jgi:hypothetical protein